jgi:hypothetical protein
MNALPAGIVLPVGGRLIRPPDPFVRGTTLAYMRAGSAEACRRLVHLAFRDAHTALDLTYAAGRFWRDPLPPGLAVTSNNWDTSALTDLHVDFTSTGLASGSYDLVVYDPPHIADGGASGIMATRYGTVRSVAELRAMIAAGAREAWRVSSVGVIVKVTEHHHGGRFLNQSGWIETAIGAPLYTKLSTIRTAGLARIRRWKAERVPRSNGAVYLVFRHGASSHLDFDAVWRRQTLRSSPKAPQALRPNLCSECDTPLDQSARKWRRTCSDACRQGAYRRRRSGS